MAKKKVLCLIDGLNQGGAERQIVGLTSLLSKQGVNVTLLSYGVDLFYMPLIKQSNINFEIISVRNNRIAKLLAIFRYVKHNQIDIIISYKDGPNVIGCLLKLFCAKLKVIVSERNTTQSIGKSDYIRFLLYRFADVIVPNSQSQRLFLDTNYPNLSSKVRVITNFTDTDYFVPQTTSENIKKKCHIVVAAKISPQKNILKFLSVINRLVKDDYNIKVSWYGNISSGQQSYYEDCVKLWRDFHLDGYFNFYPAVSNSLKIYHSGDVFCLPSIYEGFPNVICEAMSCGKPILCSNVCDNPVIVDEGRNGFLFDPNDEDDIYRVLARFYKLGLSDKEKMGKESRVMAIQKFSPDTFVKKYLDLL